MGTVADDVRDVLMTDRKTIINRVSKGFTLIEILVALFIFSIIITLVFRSFKEIAFSAKIVNESSHDYEMLNNCLIRMTADLESVFVHQKPEYLEPGFNSDPDPYRFEGNGESAGDTNFPVIRFTSLAHLPVNRDKRQGIAEIVYYVDATEDGVFQLRRSDRIAFGKDFEKSKRHPVLCSRIKKMSVKYFDAAGDEFDDWDSESEEYGYATPSHLAISIETGKDEQVVTFGTRIALHSIRDKKEEK